MKKLLLLILMLMPLTGITEACDSPNGEEQAECMLKETAKIINKIEDDNNLLEGSYTLTITKQANPKKAVRGLFGVLFGQTGYRSRSNNLKETQFKVKPSIKNGYIDYLVVRITPESRQVYDISAIGEYGPFERLECKRQAKKVQQAVYSKYASGIEHLRKGRLLMRVVDGTTIMVYCSKSLFRPGYELSVVYTSGELSTLATKERKKLEQKPVSDIGL